MMLCTKAPSDEGAVTEGDWGRENTGISMFFSPSGALRHLKFGMLATGKHIYPNSLRYPHQREALDCASIETER